MTLVVTGATGLLGSAVSRAARARGMEVVPFSRDALDVTDRDRVKRALREVSPEVVINCAAFSAVDRAEARREEALRVNRDGARWVAEGASEVGAVAIHISTDYVFDGKKSTPYRPTDPPGPLNVYGISKLAGEIAVREIAPDAILVRTSWLFGPGSRGFVGVMKKLLEDAGDPLRVVADEVSRPTYVEGLAPALLDLADAGGRGCLHLAGGGSCSRLALAEEMRRILGAEREVMGVTSEAFGAPARRPAYSVLDVGEATSLLGHELPHWSESLRRFLLAGDPE